MLHATLVIASQRVGANGSRECAPDDRLHEANQSEELDCFVASLLAMTGLLVISFAQ
jgi:hypothetical protein